MSTIKVDTITDEAGSGAPDFPNGMTGNGSSLTGLATAAQGALADTALQSSSSLAAANLTGTLPAIDGSSLTSLAAANLTGALPAIDGSALTGVGASTTYGAVGTYVFASFNGTGLLQDTIKAGSSMYPAGMMTTTFNVSDQQKSTWATGGGSQLSGTWKAMGRQNFDTGNNDGRITLFLRIS